MALITPPFPIVTLELASGLKTGVVIEPVTLITEAATAAGVIDVVALIDPPALTVTALEVESVVEEKEPFTTSVPRMEEAPADAIDPVDPIVVLDVAVGLNCVVVIGPLTFKTPAGAEVLEAVTDPPAFILTVEAEPGLKVVDEKGPLMINTPKGVDAPEEVSEPVDPIVTFEVAVGLN